MNRYFASAPGQPRARRAGNAMALAFGAVLTLWAALNADRVALIEDALVGLAQSVPLWFEQVYRVAYFLGFLLVVFILVSVLLQGRKRLDLLRDVLLAMVAATALALALVWLVEGSGPALFPEFTGEDGEPTYPLFRVALLTSVVTVASPHLARPVRRLGWLMVLLVAVSGFGLGFGLPGDAVGGFGIGLAAGSAVLLVFGSPEGYPDRAAISAALADLDLPVVSLEHAPGSSWGMRRLYGSLSDGRELVVKAYGRDAVDSQLLAKAWRTLWYRDLGQTFTYSRLQGVEHEALALMSARDRGVPTPEVLAVGMGGDDTALLATSRPGRALDPDELTQARLTEIWRDVARLHRGGMTHGALTLDAVSTTGLAGPAAPGAAGDAEARVTVVLADFAASSLVARPPQPSLDVVSLLYSTALRVDAEEAVAAARAGIGEDALVEALPYLHPPVLSRSERAASDAPGEVLSALQAAIAETTGAEVPEPARVRRVRPKDLVMPALSLFAAYALIGLLADIDFAAVWDVVQGATWAWIIVGFLIGQLVFLPEATSMLFATGYPLPLRPLTALQVSVKWIGLAVPSAAGRVAMNTLFLRKYGVPPTVAVSQGALDGLAGFLVEVVILLLALIAADLSLDLTPPELRWGLILALVVVLVVIGILAVLRVRRLRELVLPALRDGWQLLRGVLTDPKRGLGLLGSNLVARVVLGFTLWFILHAIGAPLPLFTALVVTVATNLLAGLVPIPGGIGVAEAVLTSFLVVAGLDPEEAFAAAVVFRLATFYIPAVEGLPAMRWLERSGYL